jgi:hypothetical protein
MVTADSAVRCKPVGSLSERSTENLPTHPVRRLVIEAALVRDPPRLRDESLLNDVWMRAMTSSACGSMTVIDSRTGGASKAEDSHVLHEYISWRE